VRKFTSEQEYEAVELYRGGSSTNDVATRYGVSRTAVKMLLRRHNVPIRSQGRHSTKPREIVAEQIIGLRLEGIRVRDIASRLHVADTLVAEVLIERGLHARLRRGENSTKRRRFSPDEDGQVAQEYLAGCSADKLAEKYGCTPNTVKKAITRAGVLMRRRGGGIPPFSHDPTFQSRIKALWDQGMSQTDIGKLLECSQGVVSRVLVGHFGVNCRSGGDRHGGWKGGRIINAQGYVQVRLLPDHPFASMRSRAGYVLEHRLVMAEYLGRPLLPHETVHHKDMDKTRNGIENLQLRIGKHGQGTCYRCSDCGSRRLEPEDL